MNKDGDINNLGRVSVGGSRVEGFKRVKRAVSATQKDEMMVCLKGKFRTVI